MDTTRHATLALLCCALLARGCDGGAGDDDTCDCTCDDDDDDGAPECSEDSACEDWEICDEGTCVAGDRNNDFDEAVLVADGDERTGYINPAGDVDYYRVEGSAGAFYRAYASTADPTDGEGLDTVIRFYDADRVERGYNDDFERLSNIYGTDAVYIGCTPTDDTVYLSVEDYGSFAGDPDQMVSGPDATYTFRLESLEITESEPNDAVADADDADVADYNISYDRAGVIEADGDVDLWAVDVGAGARLRIYGYEHTATDLTPRVRVLAGDGVSEMASYDGLGWDLEASVPVLDDVIYLEISDADGAGGSTSCYVLHLAADTPGELYRAEGEPNEAFGSDALAENDEGLLAVAGRIDPVSDVDRFTLAATAGDRITVTVLARTYGSPLAAHLEIFDPTQTLAVALDVPASEDAVLESFELDQSGDYTLQITAADGVSGGPGHWYSLFVEVQ